MEAREKALETIRDVVESIVPFDLNDTNQQEKASNKCRETLRDHYKDNNMSEWDVYAHFKIVLPELTDTLNNIYDWKDVPAVFKKYYEEDLGAAKGCSCFSKLCTWPGSWHCLDPKYTKRD